MNTSGRWRGQLHGFCCLASAVFQNLLPQRTRSHTTLGTYYLLALHFTTIRDTRTYNNRFDAPSSGWGCWLYRSHHNRRYTTPPAWSSVYGLVCSCRTCKQFTSIIIIIIILIHLSISSCSGYIHVFILFYLYMHVSRVANFL